LYRDQRRFEEARALFEEVVSINAAAGGAEHPFGLRSSPPSRSSIVP